LTVRGRIDDVTAQLSGHVASDRPNRISGFPERNGVFWYEDVPLAPGVNRITLTATDAAGNAASTNFIVHGVAGLELSMDPIAPEDSMKLWEGRITVTGRVKPANNEVRVNGVKAAVKPDGTWIAQNVPVRSPNRGGTATFDMTAIPVPGHQTTVAVPNERMFSQATLGESEMILNPDSPACGVFQLHLTDTVGRAFVLLTSTNLTEWQPILTNMNPAATFDYTDTNRSGCRFFRVIPLPASSHE
jgi:hypothetical protein